MPGSFDESLHPRADDGKFGQGNGTAKPPPADAAKAKKPTAKAKAKTAAGKERAVAQKHAAARAKAKTKAAEIVATAKARAKALTGGAKAKTDAAIAKATASGKKLTGAQKERHATAKAKAKAKAAEIVTKAKERAKLLKDKAGVKAPRKVKPSASAAPAKPNPSSKSVTQESDPHAKQAAFEARQAQTMAGVVTDPRSSQRTAHNAMGAAAQSAQQAAKAAKLSDAASQHSKAAAQAAAEAKSGYEKRFAKAAPAVSDGNAPNAPKQMSQQQLAKARDDFRSTATPDELEAASYYQASYFSEINWSLRSGEAPTRERELVEFAKKHLDSVLEKNRATEAIVTYRGSDSHPVFANLRPGETFVDNAYVSTSADKDRAFGGDFQFHITSPVGTKVGAINGGAGDGENEMLLARGTALRLDRREASVHPRDGYPITIMHMTVVGQQ